MKQPENVDPDWTVDDLDEQKFRDSEYGATRTLMREMGVGTNSVVKTGGRTIEIAWYSPDGAPNDRDSMKVRILGTMAGGGIQNMPPMNLYRAWRHGNLEEVA